MSQVYERIRQIDEICYIDIFVSFESLNTLIMLLYTSCIADALPLGLFITSDELKITFKKAINMLKTILFDHVFFSCKQNLGSQIFLIDDSAAERNALKLY